MKRALHKLFLLSLVLTSTINSYAAEVVEYEGLYYELSPYTDYGEATVTKCPADKVKYYGSITIPESIKYNNIDFEVTTIATSAFKDCTELTEVKIPNSVYDMKDSVFYGCTKLRNVTLSKNITHIQNCAFYKCSSLEDISIPEGVIYIGNSALAFCTSLKKIVIPNEVINMGESVFSGCKGLTDVTLSECLSRLPYRTFGGCESLKSIRIPQIMTSIDQSAFSDCYNLESITVGEGNYSYDSRDNCNAIIDTKTNTLLLACKNTIIPESVTGIGRDAYSNYTTLTDLVIPAQIDFINESAFSGCDKIESIKVDPENPIYDSRNNCNAIIHTATDSLVLACNNTVIPNSVVTANDYAFIRCNLTEPVYFSDVFAYLPRDYTDSYVIRDGVKRVFAYAFYNCTNLNSVQMPSSVTHIGRCAFAECSELNSINLPDNIEFIGEGSFQNCENLTNIAIPEGTEYIGEYAFLLCSGLTNIKIPHSVKELGMNAFAYCSNLATVTIESNSIVSTDYYMAYFDNIGTTFGNQVTSYILGDSIKVIGKEAFRFCSRLTDIVISKNVTNIGERAFGSCRAITHMTCWAKTPPSCGNGALANINKDLCTLYVPIGCTEKYQNAAQWKDFSNIVEIAEAGDANEDGDISMADANKVVNMFLDAKGTYSKTADVNKDGEVTMADANLIVNIFLNAGKR